MTFADATEVQKYAAVTQNHPRGILKAQLEYLVKGRAAATRLRLLDS